MANTQGLIQVAGQDGVTPASGSNPFPTTGGGGGGGGAVTIADGADVALGQRNQTPATDDSGTWSLIQLVKRLLSRLRSVIGINYTNASNLDIDTGGASQQVFAANADRTGLIIQNISNEPLWVDFDATAVADTPSIMLIGGGLGILQFPDSTGRVEKGAVNIIGATTGQKFVAKEAADA